jgi:hypothetical protein
MWVGLEALRLYTYSAYIYIYIYSPSSAFQSIAFFFTIALQCLPCLCALRIQRVGRCFLPSLPMPTLCGPAATALVVPFRS